MLLFTLIIYNTCVENVYKPSLRACELIYFALIDIMAAGEPDICKCVEFTACDPVDPVSINRRSTDDLVAQFAAAAADRRMNLG